MDTKRIVYRPPMEYDSLIIQVTSGCSHNKCKFCTMYKDRNFSIRKNSDIIQELKDSRKVYSSVKKIFLVDGDALVIKTESILEILNNIRTIFPECTHVASYARFSDVLRKSPEELKLLNENGLKKIYLGLESGSKEVLEFVNKNSTPEDAVNACKLLKDAGIITYLTVLLGLGGRNFSNEHAIKTAEVLNEINPDYISVMTLLVDENSGLIKDIEEGTFELLKPIELIKETLVLVEKLTVTNSILRINHASNYINAVGKMPFNKEIIINNLKEVLNKDLDSIDKYRRL